MQHKEPKCTKHHITLCPEVKLIVKKKEAEYSYQTNKNFIINEIIKEWGEMRKKTI